MKKLSFVGAVLCSCGLAVASDQEWPGLRGPRHDGGASGKLDATDGAGFAVAWRAALGCGYSSAVVAGGRAVTLLSDGVNDVSVAFDSRSGRELWRSVIAPTLRGKDGSFDGPIATPVLAGDRVFGEDDKMKPEVGVEIFNKFVKKDRVDFIMGPTSSAIAVALADLALKEKKILILTQAAANSLTDAKFNPYVFSTLSNALMHSRAGAYFRAPKGYKRWMNIGPDYAYGRELLGILCFKAQRASA